MIISKVADLLQMSDGSAPEGIRGTISQVWEVKTTQYGTIQNATLSDQGQSIRIVFSGKPEVPKSWIGKELYACGVKGSKGGLVGLKRKDNSYKDKVNPEIWVYESADLSVDGAAPATVNPSAQQTKPAAQTQQKSPNTASTPATQNPAPAPAAGYDTSKYVGAKKRLVQFMNLEALCFDAAHCLKADIEEKHGPNAFTPELAQSFSAQFYIQATREGLHLDMPTFPANKAWRDKHFPKKA